MENNIDNKETSKNNTEYLAEKFNKNIIRKNVDAKLLPGTRMNGDEIFIRTTGSDDYGPNKDLSAGYFSSIGGIIMSEREIFPELANSHFLCIHEEAEKENKMLAIISLQDKKVESRSYTPAYILFELPNKEADELVEEVKKEPDLLEKLYQKAFDGLESKNENPGLRRVKANGFYLLTEEDRRDLSLIRENYFKIGTNNSLRKMKDLFNNLEKYTYKNGPYGSGKPYNPNEDR